MKPTQRRIEHWASRVDAPPGLLARSFTNLRIHAQSLAISRSRHARRVLWTSMLIIHVTVGTSSLVFMGLYSYLVLSTAWFMDVARMLSVHYDTAVALASAILSGVCGCLHWYHAVAIIRHWVKHEDRAVGKSVSTFRDEEDATAPRTWQLKQSLKILLDAIAVRGSSFESAFLAREVLSVAVQSVQCYRFSLLVARPSLNRFVSALLILNCISTPLLQALGHKSRVMLVRLACLLVDAAVDLCVSFVVPLVIILPEFLLLVHTPGGIDLLFDNPVWFTQLHSELNMMLINTWLSCLAQNVSALTLLQSMDDIKSLIRLRPQAHTALNETVLPRVTVSHKPRSVRAAQFVLILYALLILIVHMNSLATAPAASIDATPCQLFLHPWFATRVACAVVMVNCKRAEMAGSALEIEDFIKDFDPSAINAITFAHCSFLEMPLSLQNMPRLLVVEFYNTTIANWDEEAGLDATNNPTVTRVLIIESNLKLLGHTLPPGLLHDHLPQSLDFFVISNTFLPEFPDDFHSKWPRRMGSLQCNNCGLKSLPPSYFTTQVSYKTSLANNNLTTAPVPKRININNNQIKHVPSLMDATGLVTLSMQRNMIENLDVTALPTSLTTLAIGGAPFCGGQPEVQVIMSHANVTCALLDDVQFEFPNAAWAALRGMD